MKNLRWFLFFVEKDRDCETPSWKLNLRAIADVPARWEEVDFREVLLIFENFLIRLILFDNDYFIETEIHNFYLKYISNIWNMT